MATLRQRIISEVEELTRTHTLEQIGEACGYTRAAVSYWRKTGGAIDAHRLDKIYQTAQPGSLAKVATGKLLCAFRPDDIDCDNGGNHHGQDQDQEG